MWRARSPRPPVRVRARAGEILALAPAGSRAVLALPAGHRLRERCRCFHIHRKSHNVGPGGREAGGARERKKGGRESEGVRQTRKLERASKRVSEQEIEQARE
jgi:hypothetical protein